MKNVSVLILNAIPDKKIKSIGNKCLLPIKNDRILLEYHLDILNKIFVKPEILIVDSNLVKIKTYIKKHNISIKQVSHDVDHQTNIGESIICGLHSISNPNCFIMNSSHILKQTIVTKLRLTPSESCLPFSKDTGDVGLIQNENDEVVNCYYGLPNKIYDLLYLNEPAIDTIKAMDKVSKLFLFEIINRCIEQELVFGSTEISAKDITIMNNLKTTKRITKNLCLV